MPPSNESQAHDNDHENRPGTGSGRRRDQKGSGATLSREEWIEETKKADPWEMRLRKKKRFGAARPREKAIKLLRNQGQHYLLNRFRIGIDRLRFQSKITGDLGQEDNPVETFELLDLPPKSFVGIGPVPRDAQRSRSIALIHVVWADGTKTEPKVQLREWSPHNGGTHVSNLDLRYVPRIPTTSPE